MATIGLPGIEQLNCNQLCNESHWLQYLENSQQPDVIHIHSAISNFLETPRLRAVPIFPLEFVEPRKDIVKAGARKLGSLFHGSTISKGNIGTARSLGNAKKNV